MSSTYVSPEKDMMVNAKGLRGKDGAYVSNQINPSELIILEELGRGASAVSRISYCATQWCSKANRQVRNAVVNVM